MLQPLNQNWIDQLSILCKFLYFICQNPRQTLKPAQLLSPD